MDVPAIVLAAVGALVLAGSVAGAQHPDIHPLERRVFRGVNGLPDWLYLPIWVPMQFGNLVVGTLAGLAVALWVGDWRLAVAVVLAAGMKLVAERLLRERMAGFAEVRQRPGTSEPGAVLRGDVPQSGASFPSGHVILVAAVAALVVHVLSAGVVWVPFVLAALVLVGRVYVGAHNPLDVTAGLGTGLLVGGLLTLVLR